MAPSALMSQSLHAIYILNFVSNKKKKGSLVPLTINPVRSLVPLKGKFDETPSDYYSVSRKIKQRQQNRRSRVPLNVIRHWAVPGTLNLTQLFWSHDLELVVFSSKGGF
jgi:hypothetical protein